jgi:hypothetical protein
MVVFSNEVSSTFIAMVCEIYFPTTYIPRSIFHLEWLLYVRPETFGPYYMYATLTEATEKLYLLLDDKE